LSRSSSPAPALAARDDEDADETEPDKDMMMTTDPKQETSNRLLVEALDIDRSPTTLVSTQAKRQLKRPLMYEPFSNEGEAREEEYSTPKRSAKSLRMTESPLDITPISPEVSKTIVVAFDDKTGIRSVSCTLTSPSKI
jgi:hypothetical protein